MLGSTTTRGRRASRAIDARRETVVFVRLNRVPAHASLIEALARLRAGTPAVVVDDKDGPYLVKADDIMEACNEAADSRKDPASTPIAVARKAGMRVETPTIPMEAFEKRLHPYFEQVFEPFAPNDVRYTVRRIDGETDFIVTASESFLNPGQSITICTCVGKPVHRFNQHQLKVPGKCNMPHGVAVTCKKI
jgi:hypothetical protein